MPMYQNLSGKSGIEWYDYGLDWITVKFKGGPRSRRTQYKYTYAVTGQYYVDTMRQLAVNGRGLATFIATHRGMGYV